MTGTTTTPDAWLEQARRVVPLGVVGLIAVMVIPLPPLLLDLLLSLDIALSMVVLLAALFIVVANIFVDLAYAWLDPRVRLTG